MTFVSNLSYIGNVGQYKMDLLSCMDVNHYITTVEINLLPNKPLVRNLPNLPLVRILFTKTKFCHSYWLLMKIQPVFMSNGLVKGKMRPLKKTFHHYFSLTNSDPPD